MLQFPSISYSQPSNQYFRSLKNLKTLRVEGTWIRTAASCCTNRSTRPSLPTTLSILRYHRPSWGRCRAAAWSGCNGCSCDTTTPTWRGALTRPLHNHQQRNSWKSSSRGTYDCGAGSCIVEKVRVNVYGIARFIPFNEARDWNQWARCAAPTTGDGNLSAWDVELGNPSGVWIMDTELLDAEEVVAIWQVGRDFIWVCLCRVLLIKNSEDQDLSWRTC
jgi:hypothetical protein